MKRFVVAFIIFFAVMTLMAQNNVITYTATEKLPEVTGIFDPGLHPDVFISRITSHTFSNGRGKITFADDVVSINGSAFYGCKGLT